MLRSDGLVAPLLWRNLSRGETEWSTCQGYCSLLYPAPSRGLNWISRLPSSSMILISLEETYIEVLIICPSIKSQVNQISISLKLSFCYILSAICMESKNRFFSKHNTLRPLGLLNVLKCHSLAIQFC